MVNGTNAMDAAKCIFEAKSVDWVVAREAIERHGWVQIRGLVPEAYLDELERAYLVLLQKYAPDLFGAFSAPGMLAQQEFHDAALRFKAERPRLSGAVYDSIQCSVPLIRLSSSPELVGAVSGLSGAPAHRLSNFNHGLLMAAPNDKRNFIGWHQDTFNDEAYHDYRAGITGWTPMHDTGAESGSLIVCPGSHRERVARIAQSQGQGTSLVYGLPQDYLDRYPSVQVDTQRGDALFISMNIAHTAGVNSSSRIRYTVQTRYYPFADEHFVPGKPIYKSSIL